MGGVGMNRRTVTGFTVLVQLPRDEWPCSSAREWAATAGWECQLLRRERAIAAMNTIAMLRIHQAICL
jgi:hypothetical protein